MIAIDVQLYKKPSNFTNNIQKNMYEWMMDPTHWGASYDIAMAALGIAGACIHESGLDDAWLKS